MTCLSAGRDGNRFAVEAASFRFALGPLFGQPRRPHDVLQRAFEMSDGNPGGNIQTGHGSAELFPQGVGTGQGGVGREQRQHVVTARVDQVLLMLGISDNLADLFQGELGESVAEFSVLPVGSKQGNVIPHLVTVEGQHSEVRFGFRQLLDCYGIVFVVFGLFCKRIVGGNAWSVGHFEILETPPGKIRPVPDAFDECDRSNPIIMLEDVLERRRKAVAPFGAAQ